MPNPARPFTAVVLAADRSAADPVARSAGAPCKAFAPVAGVPMILRVIRALESSRSIGRVILCGPPADILAKLPELKRRVDAGEVGWCASRESPSLSALAALSTLDPAVPVLLTTADHALIRADIVDDFVEKSRSNGADATAAMVAHASVQTLFPATRRTVLRMRDGHFCSCNLFCLMSPRARDIVSFWRGVEQSRKNPRRLVAGLLGIRGVAAYVLGGLSLHGALRRISTRIGVHVSVIVLPYPEAGVDVDTPADLALAESVLACAPANAAAPLRIS